MQEKNTPTIGVLGGGQLGKMLIQKAMQWSVPVVVLDADKDAVAGTYAHKHIQEAITTAHGIEALAACSDIITYEIEHVNTEKLIALQEQGKTIIPDPLVLQTIQDKGKQKLFYQQHQLPTAPFFIAQNKIELAEKISQLTTEKVVVKSCKGGYDGKGVFITSKQSIKNNIDSVPFNDAMMVEEYIACNKELAVLAIQDRKGNRVTYPAIEMEFDTQSNLVNYLISPASIPTHIEEKVKEIAMQTLQAFNSAGLFAIEFFYGTDGQLYINEIAPRPHNSAHHTIEGFYTSQYEQLLRVLLDLPLGNTQYKMPCCMLNIVAGNHQEGAYKLKYFEELNKLNGVYVHLYGKKTAKPNRKLGHVTICLPTKEEVVQTAHQLKNLLEIELI